MHEGLAREPRVEGPGELAQAVAAARPELACGESAPCYGNGNGTYVVTQAQRD